MSAALSPSILLKLATDVVATVTPRLVEAQQQRRHDGATLAVTSKLNDADLVTEMDSWSEETVVAGLLAERPDDGILGEEGSSVAGSSGVRWVIDPIDGTTNYFYDITGYSVSVAAQVDGQTVAALVADPVRGETYTATLGGGAHMNGAAISPSDKAEIATALIGTGFHPRPELRQRQVAALQTVLPAVRDIRRQGGAALDICKVACGRLDAHYEEGLSIWDVAAGWLILTEAGGRVSNIGGSTDQPGLVVGSAPDLHDPLIDLLNRAGATSLEGAETNPEGGILPPGAAK